MNSCHFVGRIATDIELQHSSNGLAFMRFRIAVRRPRSKEDKPDFISCKAFGQAAEFIAKYFKKGDPIWLETSYRPDQYTDQSGNTQHTHDFIVNEVGFCPTSRKADDTPATSTSGAPKTDNGAPGTLFELPF